MTSGQDFFFIFEIVITQNLIFFGLRWNPIILFTGLISHDALPFQALNWRKNELPSTHHAVDNILLYGRPKSVSTEL